MKKKPVPKVDIIGTEYSSGNDFMLKLNSNLEVKNARIELVGKDGSVLCTSYKDLPAGESSVELKGCKAATKFTVSITPAEGTMTAKELTMDVPTAGLSEGHRLVYESIYCPTCDKRELSVYVTKETPEQWEGISAIKLVGNAGIIRWRISKSDLKLTVTRLLSKDDISSQSLAYEQPNVEQMNSWGEKGNTLIPLWMLIFKGSYNLNIEGLITKHSATMEISSDHNQKMEFTTSDPEVIDNNLAYKISLKQVYSSSSSQTSSEDKGYLVMSAIKPYMVVGTGTSGSGSQITLKNVEKKKFDIDDYEDYLTSEQQTQPPSQEPLKQAVQEETKLPIQRPQA